MARLDAKRYERQLMLAMALYMAVMLGVDPLRHAAVGLPLKVALALLPVLPMFWVIALMWRRIRDSDELEQRMHLVALGVATALVCAMSLVGGFLAAAGVLRLDGAVLIWVFPVLLLGYGLVRRWLARGYGVTAVCDAEGSAWLPWYFAALAALLLALAAWQWWRQAPDDALAFLLGAACFAATGGWAGWQRARALRRLAQDEA